jgi:hypothetical protein
LGFGNAAHHMGTTRMAHDASGGVVDSNCQVFGLDNMYVAGASVFPTTDIVNPTLNLIALTARLANFILTRPTETVGFTYRFGSGRDANKALGTGWSAPEFAGIWSKGAAATLTLDRNRATTLSFVNGGGTGAQVELELNGASVYSGSAADLSGKSFPLGDDDKVALALHLSGPTPPTNTAGLSGNDAHPDGLFLQSVILK